MQQEYWHACVTLYVWTLVRDLEKGTPTNFTLPAMVPESDQRNCLTALSKMEYELNIAHTLPVGVQHRLTPTYPPSPPNLKDKGHLFASIKLQLREYLTSFQQGDLQSNSDEDWEYNYAPYATQHEQFERYLRQRQIRQGHRFKIYRRELIQEALKETPEYIPRFWELIFSYEKDGQLRIWQAGYGSSSIGDSASYLDFAEIELLPKFIDDHPGKDSEVRIVLSEKGLLLKEIPLIGWEQSPANLQEGNSKKWMLLSLLFKNRLEVLYGKEVPYGKPLHTADLLEVVDNPSTLQGYLRKLHALLRKLQIPQNIQITLPPARVGKAPPRGYQLTIIYK